MAFTYYLDNALVGQIFGDTAYSTPATLYVGLSTTTPAQGGTGITEPSGNAYARVAVPNNATNWPAPSNGTSKNGTAITFPQATGAWGTVTYFFVADAATGGNILAYGALNTAQTLNNGDTLSFAANQLTITLN